MNGEEYTYPVSYEGKSDPIIMSALAYFYWTDEREAIAHARPIKFSPMTFGLSSIVAQFRVTSHMPDHIPDMVQLVEAHREAYDHTYYRGN